MKDRAKKEDYASVMSIFKCYYTIILARRGTKKIIEKELPPSLPRLMISGMLRPKEKKKKKKAKRGKN